MPSSTLSSLPSTRSSILSFASPAFPWRRQGNPCLLLRWCEARVTPCIATLATCPRPRPRSRSWPSSGPPRRARPASRSTSPSGSTARWSTPTRCRSTAAWTSAPRSCPRPRGAASRTTSSTRSPSVSRPPSRSSRAGRATSSTGSAARGTTPVLVGGSALYTRAILDRFEFPGTDEAVRARLEQELAERGPQALHDVLDGARPGRRRADPSRERPPDRPRPRGGRADRWAVQRQPPGPRVRRPAHGPDRRRHRPRDPRRAHRRAGRGDVRQPASSRRCATSSTTAWPRAAPRPARSATARWSPTCAASSPSRRPATRPRRPPGGSRAGRTPGSARTRASSGSGTTTRSSSTKALAAVERV